MALSFDHAIIAVNDLDKAVANYQSLGFTVTHGGEHAAGTTHNALIAFKDGTYLELMAATGKPADDDSTASDFSDLVREREGYVGFALRADDLAAEIRAIQGRGLGDLPAAQPGERRRRDGIRVKWQLTRLPDGHPTIILLQDETDTNLRIPDDDKATTHSNGTLGVRSLVYVAADAKGVAEKLASVLGQEAQPVETGSQFRLNDVALNVAAPEARLTRMYQEENGDGIWRIVLRGVGDMYKRLSTASLHNAQMIIVGDNRL